MAYILYILKMIFYDRPTTMSASGYILRPSQDCWLSLTTF